MTAGTDIAVTAAAGRFPDAPTVADFWANVAAGVVSTRRIPDDDLRAAGVPADLIGSPEYVPVAGTLDAVGDFAADFFGYSPADAELIDPQQRLFLEACWEALEASGHAPRADGLNAAVFAAASFSTYTAALALNRRASGAMLDDMALRLGGHGDYLASRVAYKLGLRGPSVNVQTACSSSLTAVHLAVLSLLAGECDHALAGGAGFDLPFAGYRHQPGGVLSEDGLCRSFDARSTGSALGSAVGVVALRRLSDALADGDPVLAVIKGSAIGNDGAARPGFTAPSPDGPAMVASDALAVAGIGADDLRYVEAHGSGTPLGDHVELVGLTRALRRTTDRRGYCGLGSVKTNIGHADAAAGIAALISAIRVARTGAPPPHPLFERARDHGILADSPFVVPACTATGDGRHVLVNSMGLGGANAAVVLAPPPEPTRPVATARPVVRLVLSARSRRELDAMSGRLADSLAASPLDDVAHTLRVGRRDFTERRVVTASTVDDAAAALRLPRPPAARTARAGDRRLLVAVAPPLTLSADLRRRLDAVAGEPVDVVATRPDPVPADRFVLVLGSPEQIAVRPGRVSDQHPLPPDPDPDALDAALTAAWLAGVTIRWDALDDGTGRRCTLPTYPFTRRRAWAFGPDHACRTARPDHAGVAEVAAVGAEAAGGGELEVEIAGVWRELFGVAHVGPDDEFGALGGTSLLAVRMALDVQRRTGVLVNLHRAGGGRATVRRVAEIVRGRTSDDDRGQDLDADLALPLGPLAPVSDPVPDDVLLTGATGFLGAFLLRDLLTVHTGRIHCLVRAPDHDTAWERLRATARAYLLPEPDPERVVAVPGDLAAFEPDGPVGHVVHAAARVAFTEPYRVLRDDVTATVALLRWMRATGVPDLSYVSSIAAIGPAVGTGGTLRELPDQPLDPAEGGYGAAKWVIEHLVRRAGTDGMRVRVFRPGLILGDSTTGACNPRDLIWRLLAGGVAVGARPIDDRADATAPVDVVSAAIAHLGREPGSVGRIYHLVDERLTNTTELFERLATAGVDTKPLPRPDWHRLVADRALATDDDTLSGVALYDLDRRQFEAVDSVNWRGWLAATGRSAHVDGASLRRSLAYLATRPGYGFLG